MRRLVLLAIAVVLPLITGGAASAVSIGIGDSFSFASQGVSLTITLENMGTVDHFNGGGGYTELATTSAIVDSDIAVIFSAQVTGGSQSLDSLGINMSDTALPFSTSQPICKPFPFPPPADSSGCVKGVGTFAGAGTDVGGTISGALGLFTFDAGGNGLLNTGETSDLFFLVFDGGAFPTSPALGGPGELSDLEAVTVFMVKNDLGASGDHTETLVPEPGTALLMGLGLGALGFGSRSWRRA